MSEQKQYRSLTGHDLLQPGDVTVKPEVIAPYAYGKCCSYFGGETFLRPIEPAGWPEARLVKDCPPPDGTVLFWAEAAKEWKPVGGTALYKANWWLPMPPPPVQPKEDWEAAYEATCAEIKVPSNFPDKFSYRTGYLAAQAQRGEK